MRALPFLCAFLLGLGAAFVAGCGERENLLPASDADALKHQLSTVLQAVDDRSCGDAQRAVARARSTVQNLPDEVDARLRNRLLGGIVRLSGQAGVACSAAPVTVEETIPTTQSVVPPETTSTEVPPTETTDTTTTDTTPSTPVPPTTTAPGLGGGATPTAPSTGSTPTPDPGGVAPSDPGTGAGSP